MQNVVSNGTSFRPLTGKLVLIELFDKINSKILSIRFRPLTGKLVLIVPRELVDNAGFPSVSVPLRGSWF